MELDPNFDFRIKNRQVYNEQKMEAFLKGPLDSKRKRENSSHKNDVDAGGNNESTELLSPDEKADQAFNPSFNLLDFALVLFDYLANPYRIGNDES